MFVMWMNLEKFTLITHSKGEAAALKPHLTSQFRYHIHFKGLFEFIPCLFDIFLLDISYLIEHSLKAVRQLQKRNLCFSLMGEYVNHLEARVLVCGVKAPVGVLFEF